MEIIAYARDGGDKILIGTFESIENIHDEVEMKLEELDLRFLMSRNHRIYIVHGINEYRLAWGNKK